MASASDDFNRADSGTLGSNWTTAVAGTGPTIQSNTAKGSNAAVDGAFYNAVSFASDHQAQIAKSNSSDYQGPGVRIGTIGGGQGYVYFNHGSVQKVLAGANGEIASTTPFVSGDAASIRAVGSTLTWYKNGALVDTLSDASIGSGAPGLWFYNSIGAADDWQGTDAFGGSDSSAVVVNINRNKLRPRIFAPGLAR